MNSAASCSQLSAQQESEQHMCRECQAPSPSSPCRRCCDRMGVPYGLDGYTWFDGRLECTGCGSHSGLHHSPECPSVNAFTAGRIPQASSINLATSSTPFIAPESTFAKPRSKYHREIKPGVFVDVYDVLNAWAVTNPALQHLLKKALQPGGRGHKDLMTDLDDIIASAKRAKELEQ